MRKVKKMTDLDLRKEFNHLNERFFGSRIVLNRLEFSSMKKMEVDASGVYNTNHKSILINSGLRGYWNLVSLLLLHEMVHADLDAKDYRGYPVDEGHGGIFQIEIGRLYQAGAYDGLL